MKYSLAIAFLFTIVLSMNAQNNELPYYEIPEAPQEYTAGTTVARSIDGLGFRYYWATEGLTKKDLAFKPSEKARTTGETIDHILGLSQVILNAALNQPNGESQPEMTFAEKREKTLKNLEQASGILKESKDLSQFKMIFGETEFPFWNVINGPISDALWHVGQVVSFRRSSENPFPKGVSVLRGTKN
jgi:hypothetical protein